MKNKNEKVTKDKKSGVIPKVADASKIFASSSSFRNVWTYIIIVLATLFINQALFVKIFQKEGVGTVSIPSIYVLVLNILPILIAFGYLVLYKNVQSWKEKSKRKLFNNKYSLAFFDMVWLSLISILTVFITTLPIVLYKWFFNIAVIQPASIYVGMLLTICVYTAITTFVFEYTKATTKSIQLAPLFALIIIYTLVYFTNKFHVDIYANGIFQPFMEGYLPFITLAYYIIFIAIITTFAGCVMIKGSEGCLKPPFMRGFCESKAGKTVCKIVKTVFLWIILFFLFAGLLTVSVMGVSIFPNGIDTTKGKLFTLSPELKKEVKKLPDDTIIVYSGYRYQPILQALFKKMEQENPKIHTEIGYDSIIKAFKNSKEQDKTKLLEFLEKNQEKITIMTNTNSIPVVLSLDKSAVLNQSTDQIETSLQSQLQNYIELATLPAEKKVVGFYESDNLIPGKYMTNFTDYLGQLGVSIVPITLQEDVATYQKYGAIVIPTLNKDITQEQYEKLTQLSKNGMNFLVLKTPVAKGINLENYNKFIKEYGMTIEDNQVVIDQDLGGRYSYIDPSKVQVKENSEEENKNEDQKDTVSSTPTDSLVYDNRIIFAKVYETPITQLLLKLNPASKVPMILAGYIQEESKEYLKQNDISIKTILSTSDKGTLISDPNDSKQLSDKVVEGPQDVRILGAESTKKQDDKTTKLIAYTSQFVFADVKDRQLTDETQTLSDFIESQELIQGTIKDLLLPGYNVSFKNTNQYILNPEKENYASKIDLLNKLLIGYPIILLMLVIIRYMKLSNKRNQTTDIEDYVISLDDINECDENEENCKDKADKKEKDEVKTSKAKAKKTTKKVSKNS